MDEAGFAYYEGGHERARLGTLAKLEGIRTLDLLERLLPPAPARVYDVGGGPGAYAAALGERGYEVVLLDPVPLHIEQARAAGVDAVEGDARRLPWPDASADAVVMLGPLYHLVERAERVRALEEARRVLRPGGVVVVAAISRFASLFSGLYSGFLLEPGFEEIVTRDVRTGQHRNPDNHPRWFTTTFFHSPQELEEEVAAAGLTPEALLAVEGPAEYAPDAEQWLLDERRELLLRMLRLVEAERDLLAASAHFVAVARR